jgi:cell division protein FtsW
MVRARQESLNNKVKLHSYYDYSLLFLTLFLVGFGLIMVYSSSSYMGEIHKNGDSMYYLKRQGASVALGIAAMIFISKLDYRILIKKISIIPIKLATLAYLLAIGLQIYVLFFGIKLNEARRWISLGSFGTFQPSDFSKAATIIFVAYIINLAPKKMHKPSGFVRITLFMAPLIVLIAKENLSTAIVISGIMVGISFVASKKKWYYFFAAIIFSGMGAAYILLGDAFRSGRIQIWLNVETHKDAFQILQGLYAIASGRLFGTGLGESMQKLGYVPEAQNDMIFAIICEELGLFGAVTVILLFILLIWRLFIIAISAPDLFGGLLCVGVLTHIAIQVIINIAVVTNSIPSTGIALPFISYGGTSVALLLIEMGIALSVSNQIIHEK